MINTLKRLGFQGKGQLKAAIGLSALSVATVFAVAAKAEVTPPPPSLSHLSVPKPSNLDDLLQSDKSKAVALGKALFWDMSVGSDGVQSCASCHFSAGADPRVKNQLSPKTNGNSFAFGGPNYTLKADDFPFVKFANSNKQFSTKVRDFKIVTSSAGVFNTKFLGVEPGASEEQVEVVHDIVFNVDDVNTRRVEPRNTPTVINAVFNFRNFWDGRAQNIFNGVNKWGKRDKTARVFRSRRSSNPYNWDNPAEAYDLKMRNASLASQAVEPPLSKFEMSAHGRDFQQLARKLLSKRALEKQEIAHDDSVLASYRDASGLGLNKTYEQMIKEAFNPRWWNANQPVSLNGKSYSQMEANFSLYFGLALQMYESTLISGQSPYDRFADGDSSQLTLQQKIGFGVFMGKGKCASCHSGSNFSSASFKNKGYRSERMHKMMMGNHKEAVYDEGFYNIGVTRTEDDLGVGGKDAFGNPLSFSAFSKIDYGRSLYYAEGREHGNVRVTSSERVGVRGAFKTPTLRNVALTAPYFHNGSAANLMQVVEFYNRGGNFRHHNINDFDADIRPLHLSQSEKEGLVAFLEALTDHRVTMHKAPFDHPSLIVSTGHVGDDSYAEDSGLGNATDEALLIPAVGQHGYSNADQTFNQVIGLDHYAATESSEPDSPRPYNLSQGKHAKQSSEAYRGYALRAVDGNTSGEWRDGSVTHTRWDAEAWWQVDLGQQSKITSVNIYGRNAYTSRLEHFGLAISPHDMTGKSVAQLKSDPNVNWVSIEKLEEAAGSFVFDEVDGRYVRVMLEGRNYLNLAEVEVYGFDGSGGPIPKPKPEPKPEPVFCAKTWGTCTIPTGKTATVYYGLGGKSKTNMTGSFSCNRYVFGASLLSGFKSCYYVLD